MNADSSTTFVGYDFSIAGALECSRINWPALGVQICALGWARAVLSGCCRIAVSVCGGVVMAATVVGFWRLDTMPGFGTPLCSKMLLCRVVKGVLGREPHVHIQSPPLHILLKKIGGGVGLDFEGLGEHWPP